jgi:hypothetical protein
MTNYNLKPIIPPSLEAKLKKEARRKVLEAIRERRREMYKNFKKKMQLRTSGEML